MSSRRGVTLLELIIVMVIIGIAATLTVPAVGSQIARYRLKAAAREISNFILESRTEAVKNADSSNPVFFRLVFNTGEGTYFRQKYEGGRWAQDGVSKSLPAGVSIYSTENTDCYFKTDGSALLDTLDETPGNGNEYTTPFQMKIKLQNSKGAHYQVNLNSLTGTAEVREGWD